VAPSACILPSNGYNDGMSILLPILAIVVTALCIWLAVRTINRRGRWANWMLAIAAGLSVLYVMSFGPACWLTARTDDFLSSSHIELVYSPIIQAGVYGPALVCEPIVWWGSLGLPPGRGLILSTDASRFGYIWLYGR
jgi:hypothetical protein